MKSSHAALVACAALAVIGAGASRAAPAAKLSPVDDARATMRTYVACIVKDARGGGNVHKRLVAFLSTSPGSAAGRAAGLKLSTPDCLGQARTTTSYVSQLRFQPDLLRGEVFRALYLQRLAQPSKPSVQPAEIAAGWASKGDEAAMIRRFGDCVVDVDRINAAAAINSDVVSPAETDAYRALNPALAQCISPGQTLHFSRAVLEGALAEGLYRQATGNGPAPATEAN